MLITILIIVVLNVRVMMMVVVPVFDDNCATVTHRGVNGRQSVGIGPVRLAERGGRLPEPPGVGHVDPMAGRIGCLRNTIW
jgi:hypothetical protein